MTFDPNATGNKNAGLFSLPFSEEESKLVVIPVPWEVTTSYGHGTSLGPDAVLEASKQLDVQDALYGDFYKQGIFQRKTDQEWLSKSQLLKEKALHLREKLENGEDLDPEDQTIVGQANKASMDLNEWVYEQTQSVLKENKIPAVLGGDHSCPLGIMKALKEKYEDLSILHIDAHHDLRKAYQGYKYSHASIMYNVMEELSPSSLVQLGIRDFCPEEFEYAEQKSNIHCFYDSKVAVRLSEGENWNKIVEEALNHLSGNVYISFDIDGLMPDLCPHTGTPVPGGLSFSQAETLLYKLSQSTRNIVGFDLCEVSPESAYDLDCWDSNVGARVLFKLCGATLRNNN